MSASFFRESKFCLKMFFHDQIYYPILNSILSTFHWKKRIASMGWKVSHLHYMYKLTTNIISCVMRPKIRLCRQDHSLILTRETVNPACKRVQALERAAKSWEDTFRSQTFHPLIILGMEKDLRCMGAFTAVWDYVNRKNICRLSAIFWQYRIGIRSWHFSKSSSIPLCC